MPHDNQMLLDLALDYARAGLYSEAVEILGQADKNALDGSLPMIFYALGYFDEILGDIQKQQELAYSDAASGYARLLLPEPNRRVAYSGNRDCRRIPQIRGLSIIWAIFLYDRCRHREAIEQWERSTELDPSFSVAWRNLGIGYFNVLGDTGKARDAFDKAIRVNPEDARVFYERDQLWKRIGEAPENRLKEFDKFATLISRRDDLSVELAGLYNQTGQHEKALALLESRKFQPWEGGEGLVLNQYVRTHLALGRRELAAGNAIEARRSLRSRIALPRKSRRGHASSGQSERHLLSARRSRRRWR